MVKCDNCSHKEVCNKKDAYKTACENIKQFVGEFEVEVKCKHYAADSLVNDKALREAMKKYENPCPFKRTKPWPNYPMPYIGDPLPITWSGGSTNG
jgi:hypothetical protein